MEPNIWGKHAWVFLHSISMNYPDKPSISDKKNYKDFFENLKFILPCEVCKKHYSQHIHKNPIENALKSKNDLVEWVINVHNQVNISLNKPTMTFDQVIEYYKKLYNGDITINDNPNLNNKNLYNGTKIVKNNNKYLGSNIIIIIIITISLLFYILWKNI